MMFQYIETFHSLTLVNCFFFLLSIGLPISIVNVKMVLFLHIDVVHIPLRRCHRWDNTEIFMGLEFIYWIQSHRCGLCYVSVFSACSHETALFRKHVSWFFHSPYALEYKRMLCFAKCKNFNFNARIYCIQRNYVF